MVVPGKLLCPPSFILHLIPLWHHLALAVVVNPVPPKFLNVRDVTRSLATLGASTGIAKLVRVSLISSVKCVGRAFTDWIHWSLMLRNTRQMLWLRCAVDRAHIFHMPVARTHRQMYFDLPVCFVFFVVVGFVSSHLTLSWPRAFVAVFRPSAILL